MPRRGGQATPEAAERPEGRDGATTRDAEGDGRQRQEAIDAGARNAAEDELFFDDDRRSARPSASSTASSTRRRSGPRTTTTSCRIQQQIADLVPVSPFWLDYARHDGKAPFLSRHLADASRNFTEMMFALSVLDLPFEAGKHDVQFAGGKMTLTPGRPGDRLPRGSPPGRRPRRPAADPRQPELLPPRRPLPRGERREVRQVRDRRVRRPHRLRLPGRRHQPDLVPAEADACCCNSRSARSRSPTASPPGPCRSTWSRTARRRSTTSSTSRRPGKFAHFPVHVAKNEQLVAAAQPVDVQRGRRSRRSSTPTSWDYVSQNGTTDEVLAFLNRENVRALNLDKIAFRMQDRGVLRVGHRGCCTSGTLYHPTLWSYGLFHTDPADGPRVPAARRRSSSPSAAGRSTARC